NHYLRRATYIYLVPVENEPIRGVNVGPIRPQVPHHDLPDVALKLASDPAMVPALIRGLHLAAYYDLGFTSPTGELFSRLKYVVRESGDPVVVIYAAENILKGVPPHSKYYPLFVAYRNELIAV